VDITVFLAVVERVGDNLFAVSVREKVDGTRGDDTDEGGTETFEEGARRFFTVYVSAGSRSDVERICQLLAYSPKYVSSLDKVIQEPA